jgi:hypothetical protein
MSVPREIIESPWTQGQAESQVHTLTTTPWGSNPTSITVKIFLNGVDVSSTCLTGSPSVVGDVITLPAVHSLAVDTEYRLEVTFTCNGSENVAYAKIYGEA